MTMTQRRIGAHGLPVFQAHELTAIKAEGYTAVLVLAVGDAIAFGVSGDPNRYVRNVAGKTKCETKVLRIAWAPDASLARRIKGHVERLLCDRQLPASDHFDVPQRFALGAVDIAANKVGLSLASTDEILGRGDVQRIRWLASQGRLLDSDRHLV